MEITKVDNQYIIINKNLTHIFRKALEAGNISIVNEIYESNKDCIDKCIKNRLCWDERDWYHYNQYTNNLDSIKWIFEYVNRFLFI